MDACELCGKPGGLTDEGWHAKCKAMWARRFFGDKCIKCGAEALPGECCCGRCIRPGAQYVGYGGA